MEIPPNTDSIADGTLYESDVKNRESLKLGMKFFADTLNRMFFLIVVVLIAVIFCITFVQAWIRYDQQ